MTRDQEYVVILLGFAVLFFIVCYVVGFQPFTTSAQLYRALGISL